jgi:HEAT repeats
MPAKRNLDAELSTLETLRDVSPEVAEPQLAKALSLRNNLIVSRAAAIALHHGLTSLAPNLVTAFSRFLENPAKSDPQCWAKNAIAKTLAGFEFQEPDLFLAGMRHIQLEPVWGGSADSAGTLRSTCALALVQCRELNSHRLLVYLTPLLADKELRVRVNVVRAIEQVGNDSAVLLLRLLAALPSGDPELLGACYSAVLALEGPAAIEWAAQFLPKEDDAAAEAAMAIAQTHTPEAFQLLRTALGKTNDPWFRNTLLAAIALTRQQEATRWLLDLVANDDDEAAGAYEALCRSAPSEDTQERLKQLGRPCAENPTHPERA